ncbi:hypothetical protein LCGC14_2128670 [marine sediment metagenome]|uniref:Uncharacterized protein n=1 Tax=marine sediment metagenome TaxID=412755 RepID=A0A0F9E246_9ZZZZ
MIYSVGIDIASEKFDVVFKEEVQGIIKIKGSKNFSNNAKGFGELLQWSQKRQKNGYDLLFVMEATGVYHENLCYFLYDQKEKVKVVLPQKVKYYAKSLNIKTKTDKVDAGIIAEIGLERSRKLRGWQPPSKQFKAIRDISREVTRLKKSKSAAASQVHALQAGHESFPEVVDVAQRHQENLGDLINELEDLLLDKVKEDEKLYEKLKKISTIKGLGILSAIKIIAETNGFLLFDNIKQVVSYAGLDIIERQSGKYNGKSRLSKKGNAYLRQILYMPAVSAATHNKKLKNVYGRLNEKFIHKKQSLVAVMRKLLVLTYTLWKNGQEYNPNHQWQGEKRKREVALPR